MSNIYKSETIVPAINRPDQEQLDDISYGLEHILDENEKAMLHNSNVQKNTQGKENLSWPNKGRTRESSMAEGLAALEKLGADDYSAS